MQAICNDLRNNDKKSMQRCVSFMMWYMYGACNSGIDKASLLMY